MRTLNPGINASVHINGYIYVISGFVASNGHHGGQQTYYNSSGI